jgi:hypothetical protein
VDACDGEPFYRIHEVYYAERSDQPTSATEDAVGVCGGSIAELRETLTRMLRALDKPILEWHKEQLKEVAS